MNCYTCERGPHAGGLRYDIRQAVGICHDCGVAVCPAHGTKLEGQPFRCRECLETRWDRQPGQPLSAVPGSSARQEERGR